MNEGKEKIVTLRPYDNEVADDVFSVLFYGSSYKTEDGYMEVPADSYQLIVSALDLIRWEVHGDDYVALMRTKFLIEDLRDKQKRREFKRTDMNMTKAGRAEA